MNTKEKILETSRILFNQHGYHNVTMRMISTQTDISLGNLTYHFRKKEDLLRELMKEAPQLIMSEQTNKLCDITQCVDNMLTSFEKYHFFFTSDDLQSLSVDFASQNAQTVENLNRHFVDILNNLAARGYFVDSFDEQARMSYVKMVMLAHIAWAKETSHHSTYTSMSKDEFIALHMNLLKPFFTAKAWEEYHQ